MTTPPPPPSDELPTFTTGGLVWRARIDLHSLPGLPMRVPHLTALLSALDPAVRSRVLEPYQDTAYTDMCRSYDAVEAALTRKEAELTAARAEVERLKAELSAGVAQLSCAADDFRSLEASFQQAIDERKEARRGCDQLRAETEQIKARIRDLEGKADPNG